MKKQFCKNSKKICCFFAEPLKFIPHTCYMGTQLCKPVATDCAHYQRLRDCCCTKYALQKCTYRKRKDNKIPTMNQG